MNITIYDINFINFKTIQIESLHSFLSNIENLNDRDIRFLSSNTRLSYFAIRDEIIVLKMDFIKSIITKEHLYIIKEQRTNIPLYSNNQFQITIDNINQINKTIKSKKRSASLLKLSGLEAILCLIEQYFSKSVQLLLPKVNNILSEIYYPSYNQVSNHINVYQQYTNENDITINTNIDNSGIRNIRNTIIRNNNSNIYSNTINNTNNTIKFKNFLRIQKELIDLEFRVKEVYNIIEELEEDVEKLKEDDEDNKSGKVRFDEIQDKRIKELEIQNQLNDENDELEEILSTYNIFINQILSEVQKYGKEMETTKEYVNMLMAQKRNDIAHMNIYSSVLNLSISSAMLISSFFGMNLTSNLENSTIAFVIVILVSLIMATSIIFSFHNYMNTFKN